MYNHPIIKSSDWQNPELTSKNREKAVSFFVPYSVNDSIEYENFDSSSKYYCLNGEWNFKYFDAVYDIPENVYTKEYGVTGFDTIKVPLSWQMAGYEKPHYVNANYPIPTNPPYVPSKNPAGVYKKSFTLPSDFNNQRLFINFEGVNSFYYLFINGEFVGFSKAAHSLARFEITDFVKSPEFEVTVIVLKWCDGTYLEDQDCYRFNGIYRDVYITARPKDFIDDIDISCKLENNYSIAKINVNATVNGNLNNAEFEISDPDGNVLKTQTVLTESNKFLFNLTVDNPKKWTAETPYLYTLTVKTNNEIIPIKFGVRSIETSQKGQLLVNGKPIKLYGVNRHDSNPKTGHYVTIEDMLTDLYTMKRHNVNTIRTSHYPNSSIFLTLCDRLGFYVIDEGDIESHGCGVDFMMDTQLIGDNPIWQKAFIDRVERMMTRDRNHPSVIMWSMGNESLMGENQRATIDFMAEKAKGDGRLIHYEAAWRENWDKFGSDALTNIGDVDYKGVTVRSRMYSSVESIKKYLASSDSRPFFLCEFCHAMGVGPGGLKEYMELIENNDNFIGGCIWEWCDHSVADTDPATGKRFYTYGGYYGDFPNDGNFCVDGLVYPDRTPHTGLLEYAQFIKPLYAKVTAENEITVFSRYDFKTADNFSAILKILRDGEVIREEKIDNLNIPPRSSKKFTVNLEIPNDKREYTLYISFIQKEATLWSDKDYEIGFCDLKLKEPEFANNYFEFLSNDKKITTPLSYIKDRAYLTVKGTGFAYTFNTSCGVPVKIVKNGITLMEDPAGLSAFRAPIDNDRNIKEKWYRQHLNHLFTTATDVEILKESEDKLIIKATVCLTAATIKPITCGTITYTVNTAGEMFVDISTETRANLSFPLPRYGMEFMLSEGFEDISYLGNGPKENYPDFKNHSHFAKFDSTVSKQYEPYVFPQSCGNHTNVRWLTLKHKSGETLTFVPKGKMHFTAMHFTETDLETAMYTKDLIPRDKTVVHIDYKNGGIGSNSCGPLPYPQYTIDCRYIDFSFKLF